MRPVLVMGSSNNNDFNPAPSSSRSPAASGSSVPEPDPFVTYVRGEKRNTAKLVQMECLRVDQVNSQSVAGSPILRNVLLDRILDDLLDPRKKISDPETISWLNYLIAEGRDPADFVQLVKSFDNAVSCGLVWTANFVAYRCRTCGISPCMSLCAECFQKGRHEGHDYNMFRSQAGGACDCGDPSVMKESGFCSSHQPGANDRKPKAPTDLLIVGKSILPRLLQRLLIQLRKNSSEALKEADDFLTSVLTAMTEMGAAMRSVMTGPLIEQAVYSALANGNSCFFYVLSIVLKRMFSPYSL